MKKFLAILAIAGVFTACNNESEGGAEGDTTTTLGTDTATLAPLTTDTAAGGTGMDTTMTTTTTDTTTVR